MAPVLEGLKVVDLSWGIAGPVTTMLLGDYGAEVVKVEPPGGDPFRSGAGYAVWNRNKKSVVLDLHDGDDRRRCRELIASSDVVVESFSPGTTARLGVDYASVRDDNPALVYCSITGYGRTGTAANRPGYDGLVQARFGMQNEQPGHRPGPIFLHLPLPSFGAALMASVGIHAALLAKERTGRGQWVETSLAQGVLTWMTQIWKRAETPTLALSELWRFKEFPPTPCFEGSDGKWFHPMPQGVAVALAHVGRDPDSLPLGASASGDYETRDRFFRGLRELYRQRPMAEWVDLLQSHDVACQPIGTAVQAFGHPQVVHNRASVTVEQPGTGAVVQYGHAYHLEHHEEATPTPPPAVGEHTEEVLAALDSRREAAVSPPRGAPVALRHALEGVRVLDFGTALAGPFGPMVLSDLGADVIKIDPVGPGVGTPADATYAACQRGKRSIAIDLKSEGGRRVARDLIASADVIHYNLRTGVAERLGFGYEQAKAINPRIVFCHLTSYGNTGPLARWPGVDQMGQAMAGLEHEQGATPTGGHPTWYRFGMCDATAGLLSIIGVLQALRERDRTGQAQWVEANILNGAMFLASATSVANGQTVAGPHLDPLQMGLGPLYRLYPTSDGWLCVAAHREDHWRSLCLAIGQPELAEDPRFASAAARAAAGPVLSDVLEAVFGSRPAADWVTVLDAHGVPCEVSSETWGASWFDDPDVIANGWVADYQHPVWGRLQQPGAMVDLSATPTRIAGPPPVIGEHTAEILKELGYDSDVVGRLRDDGAIGW
jgi:crotonobetainyl-CoA:carnitine CoA-transferase CaiB-like acyl-CoA transferase